MRKTLFLLLLVSGTTMFAEDYTVKSPDERILINVETGVHTTYSVTFNGKMILNPSPLSMTFDNGVVIGRNMRVTDVEYHTEDRILKPIIRQKSDEIRDCYNEMVLSADQYKLYFRAYNDGIAYRFHTDFSDSLRVISCLLYTSPSPRDCS